ncbi:hypothetical protein L0Z72_07910 [candidate division KSB1 bacterium]|nr:hypothetical protein [candidate division KSB1 bacterium]
MNNRAIRWQQGFQKFESAFQILHGTIDRSLAVTGQYRADPQTSEVSKTFEV